MPQKQLVSIVIPTLNEEKNLGRVIKEIRKFFESRRDLRYEIIVVDGHSTDRTVEIARRLGCKVLFDELGKGSALRKGMKAARGSIVVTMDADLSHRAIELGMLIEAIKAGYDVAMGSRFIQGGGTEDMPWYRKLGNKFFVWLVNLIWGTKYSDLCYGYRSFNRRVLKALLPKLTCNGFGIETEISIKAAKLGLKCVEIPSFEKPRASGEGKLKTFRDGVSILRTILKELLF